MRANSIYLLILIMGLDHGSHYVTPTRPLLSCLGKSSTHFSGAAQTFMTHRPIK